MGYGLHLSSVQNILFVTYFVFLFISCDGIDNLGQLKNEVLKDVKANLYIFNRKKLKNIRWGYTRQDNIKVLYQLCFSIFVCFFGFFIFEIIWVHLYNFFQFGDWLWPIYYFERFPLNILMLRNYGVIVLSLASIYFIYRFINKGRKTRMRFNSLLIPLLVISIASWGTWIVMPGPIPTFQYFYDQAIKPNSTLVNDPVLYIMPKGLYFKQTVYTVYEAVDYMTSYPSVRPYSLYLPDDFIHFINVFTKYATSISCMFPFLVRPNKK